jgi:hypothetical protein
MMKLAVFTAVLLMVFDLAFSDNDSGYAHNFYQNQDSMFFTQGMLFQIENKLAASNFPSNVSVALTHSENALTLLEDIFLFNIDILDDAGFFNIYESLKGELNSTTTALVAANLADESLKQYGIALGLDVAQASRLLNMSTPMAMGTTMDMMNNTYENRSYASNQMAPMLSADESLNKIFENSSDVEVINQANYQTAVMLANSLNNLFVTTMENATLQNSTGLMRIPVEMKSESASNLGKGIDTFESALNKKASLEEVFSLVHGQIHSNLFLAFDLKLKGD